MRATIVAGQGLGGGIIRLGSQSWIIRNARRDELSEIRAKCLEFTPNSDDLRPLEEAVSFHERCPPIFRVLQRYFDCNRELSKPKGYAIVYPLKSPFARRLMKGQAWIRDANFDDIFTRRGASPSGYHIAFLWRESRAAQGAIVTYLFSALNPPPGKSALIFAVPTTSRSLAFLRKNNFHVAGSANAIPNFLDICYRQLPLERLKGGQAQAVK